MELLPIVSREYKVMVRASLFAGDEPTLLAAAERFWGDLGTAARDVLLGTEGRLDRIKKRREIRFWDTEDRLLRRHGYVFRERRNLDTDDREVTLKLRHQDRYHASDRDMGAARRSRAKTKLEEDIKPPFLSLYSHSTTQPIAPSKNLNRMRDPGRLFPGLAEHLDRYDEEEAIRVVGNLVVRECVLVGASFRLGDDPEVEAECALIVWYDEAGEEDEPVVAEVSFRYRDRHEGYRGPPARRAYDFFRGLRRSLTVWLEPDPVTKTAFVFSLA